jgi:hypothetical protein
MNCFSGAVARKSENEVARLLNCHGSAGTPLGTHAGGETLGLQDARTAIRT